MSGYTSKQYEVVIDRYQMIRNKSPEFVQYDTETAKLNLVFLENGIPFIIPYERLVLIIKKPDQKEVYQEIETFSENTAEIILNNQALTVVGTLQCQIRMYQDSKLESTWTFEVKVKPSIGNDNPIRSENEYGILHQLIQEVDGSIRENEQAIQALIEETQQSVSESIEQNNQAVIDALAQIDESELVRLKNLIELLQQEKLGIHEKAVDSALLNGVSESTDAIANSLAKRDGAGDLTTATAIIFKGRGSMGIDPSKGSPTFKDDTNAKYDIWNAKNVPIESGSWTPVLTNGTTSFQMNTASTFGEYYRIGDMVYIQGRARASSKTGVSGGGLAITGLPFTPFRSGQGITLGLYSGLVFHSEAKDLVTYLPASVAEIRFYFSRSGASYQVWNCDNVSGECDIYFSGSYRIN